ncbi:MauE/DoxX family redox-associated membrane protein [Paenibacillus elgii]|uniref:MauE/DoxX family redox-associated membrane protein n=1 Tax=Paenibacillus elgii TaxID=189691 RepID=UPI000248C07F|nr:MauE/DoxX family redox-associated membrane protein [Paenibacillus elgii]
MEALSVIFRILLAILFISSSVSSLRHWQAHLGIIKDYKILPVSLIRWFAILEHTIKWLVGIFLLFGMHSSLAALTGSGLLLMYSIAITINLLRDRRELSCGCGGLAGNHLLSWKLIVRNLFLIGMCLWVNQIAVPYGSLLSVIDGEIASRIFGREYWVMAGTAILSALLFSIMDDMLAIRKKMQQLLAKNRQQTR